MRRLIFIVATLVLLVGVVFAAPPREWLATPMQQQAILRLVQEQQQLDTAEKQLRDAREEHAKNVQAVIAEISSALGTQVVPDLRPGGKVVFREVTK